MPFCNIELSKTARADGVRGIKIRESGNRNSWREEDESNTSTALQPSET